MTRFTTILVLLLCISFSTYAIEKFTAKEKTLTTGIDAALGKTEQSAFLNIGYSLNYYYKDFMHAGIAPLLSINNKALSFIPDLAMGYTIPISDTFSFDFTLASKVANLPYMVMQQASFATGLLGQLLGVMTTDTIRYISSFQMRDKKKLYSAQLTYHDDNSTDSSILQKVSLGISFSTFTNF